MKAYRFLIPVLALLASCAKPQSLVYKGISNFYISGLGVNSSSVGADVMLYNPNPYELQLKSADLDVFLNNRPLGKAVLDRRLDIPARDSIAVPVQVKAALKDVLVGGLQVLKNPEVNVKILGDVKAGRRGLFVNVPIRYEGKQRVTL